MEVKGEIYTGGKSFAGATELTDLPTDFDFSSKESSSLLKIGAFRNMEGTFTVKRVWYNRLNVLSLLYGFKVTNNYLKLHGGVKCRNCGKRKRGK